jgi:signal transduction histidine kinase
VLDEVRSGHGKEFQPNLVEVAVITEPIDDLFGRSAVVEVQGNDDLTGWMHDAIVAIAPERLRRSTDINDCATADIRDRCRLVADLRPTALEQIGLVEALRQYADTVTLRSQGSLMVRIDAGPLPALSGDVEVAAYRIVLEAVTNVSRHAEASHCVVTVAPDDEQLGLVIADNGVGIKGTPQRPGLGLRSMVERATELGGSCTVSAGAPTRTVVMATFPS